MPDITLTIAPVETFEFEAQDRKSRPVWTSVLTTGLSLLVIAAALYAARGVDLADVTRMVPSSPFFWSLFALSYLAGPACDWIIFRRLWQAGPAAFGALVRKLVYNELIIGYLGEVYFYGWARRNLKLVATPFGAVKDVAVMSAVAGNIMTLVLLSFAFPVVRMLPLTEHASAIGWSLAFVIATSLVVMVLRGSILSLHRRELFFVIFVHIGRIIVTTLLSAILWHLVLPDTPVIWWLVLATVRLLISRLPFVPNKDVIFAGVAVFALGDDVRIAELMTMMAGLMVVTHMLVGMAFALADLFQGTRDEPDDV